MDKATLQLGDNEYELDVVEGTEGEVGVDLNKFRSRTKAITLDPGYGNTGSCQSSITFINGEEGVLRYRGYPIEQLAEKASFEEVIYLLVWGELPTESQLDEFRGQLAEHGNIPAELVDQFDALPDDLHPMAALSSTVVSLSGYYEPSDDRDLDITRLIAKFKALVALGYRRSKGLDLVQPGSSDSYVGDFVNMMFGEPDDVLEQALNKLLILHADHEQNCSASTVRMVGSSHVNLYASVAAGICALWGPLHGGANQRVIEMLEEIQNSDLDVEAYVEKVKDKESGERLMGFGHRVYKNFDPRAKIIKKSADDILGQLNIDDPSLDIAKELEQKALEDPYFVERKLYPNVDFYSGIIYRALGIPVNMFTVMFALGRLPGWISQWKEWLEDPRSRIHRPRQIYIGEGERDVPPISER